MALKLPHNKPQFMITKEFSNRSNKLFRSHKSLEKMLHTIEERPNKKTKLGKYH